ncbi:hypothetical protein LO772_19530 [Yinghuangia sp. ASG 101]|uniref:DUF6928 family protein n=1 Tax=Yinghuangia sp. ASG 101 TaxID=2896848 RepID=UPI001E4C2101|nr:hypothetical protein [Yinghuangia sp. ASG 101]UGQ09150.1 hypothetical protein LO772_19530 [Yinghuangia sp. ASG 101]
MGAKTGLLAFAAGSIGDALRSRPAHDDRARAETIVRRLYPGWRITAEEEEHSNLSESAYPSEGVAYAVSFPGVDILCDRKVMVDYPSQLPSHYVESAEGRTVVLHAMHSVVDWLAFAVWRDGVLVRSLSLSPDGGVREDIGERLPFEERFWSGACPVEPDPGWPNQAPYPLPFHPLELGEEALRELFGFVMEGRPESDDIDAFDVPVHRFRLTDPEGPTPEQRKAERDARVAAMGPPLRFRREGGRWVEIDEP